MANKIALKNQNPLFSLRQFPLEACQLQKDLLHAQIDTILLKFFCKQLYCISNALSVSQDECRHFGYAINQHNSFRVEPMVHYGSGIGYTASGKLSKSKAYVTLIIDIHATHLTLSTLSRLARHCSDVKRSQLL